ncbi:hypothetical protein CCAN2_160001 [Capnocytophaga canimorsus]|nr:hypothetical protein CCAN2_160001 [Capnocytophaga canimorsus]
MFFVAWCMNFTFKWIGTPLQVSMLSVMIISFTSTGLSSNRFTHQFHS